jgi:predicted ATPase
MFINKIHIKNYKSLVDSTIINPNPFTVFFGTNAAGKSNLFEAIELSSFVVRKPSEALQFFGGFKELFTFQKVGTNEKEISIRIETPSNFLSFSVSENTNKFFPELSDPNREIKNQLGERFSRIFLGNKKITKEIFKDDKKLTSDGSNKAKVLSRLLKDSNVKEEIIEWLKFIIPEFKDLEVKQHELTGEDYIVIYEEYSSTRFSGNLISDGTENSISLITAIYQSDEPQFLLIEEPENGLNPKVIKEFVHVCRELVKEKGHTIWLATHSQTLVSELTPEEAIMVYKEHGFTQIKQFFNINLHGLRMDDAWLSNVLGGGIPW